jgi:adenosylmethionine-8-amino-7-oxononanoate aminotransferase
VVDQSVRPQSPASSSQRCAISSTTLLDHVMLAGFTHEPVVALMSERLSALTGGRLGHAFYASDGASATEIALKMSLHYWRNSGGIPARTNSCVSPAAITAKRSVRWR